MKGVLGKPEFLKPELLPLKTNRFSPLQGLPVGDLGLSTVLKSLLMSEEAKTKILET